MKKNLRIRTLLHLSLLLTLVGVLVCGLWLADSINTRNRLSEIYDHSHVTAQEGARLLQLTYSLGSSPSTTVEEQWQLAHAELIKGIGSMDALMSDKTDLLLMQERSIDLKDLYDHLKVDSGSYPQELLNKRLSILMDRMITEAHQVTEAAYIIKMKLHAQQEAQIDQLISAFLIAMGALLLSVLSFGFLVRQRVLQPLVGIEAAADEIRQGNLSARVPIGHEGDEIGDLAKLLNSLAHGVESRIQTLNELNLKISQEVHERELSEIKLADALTELQTTSNLLESAGRISGVGGWVLDMASKEFRWSEQMYVIIEAPRDYIPTLEDALDHYPGEARETITQAFDLALAEGQHMDVELPFITMKGRTIWVQIHGEVHFEKRNSVMVPTKIVGALQDISQRKASELILQKAKLEAESASRAKGEFLANMSHEIRTPLNAIVGISYILRNSPLNDEQRDLINKLDGAGRNLIELISDILDLSKIDAGKFELDNQDFTIYELFDSLASIAAGYQVKSGVDVVFAPSAKVPDAIVGDGTKIKQILVNLLGNALKFTESGYVQVACDVVEFTSTDCLLEFSVEDSGIGMNESGLAQLFSAFSQVDNSISRKYGGTGIGLALSQKLVNKMGGKIEVESTPGKGSRFSFQLSFPMAQTGSSQQAHEEPMPDVALLFVGVTSPLLGALEQFAERYSLPFSSVEAIDLKSNIQPSKQTVAFFGEGVSIPAGSDSLFCIKICQTHFSALAIPMDGSVNHGVLKMPITPSAFIQGVKSALSSKAPHQAGLQKEPNHSRSLLDGITLLAVDDSKLNLKILKKILVDHGAEVYTAEDGSKALDMLKAHMDEIDLCLMDVQMPVMDGLEACRRIRHDLGLKNLPVLALTAGAMLAEHQNAMNAGMNAVLMKPLDIDKVVQSIRSWVTRRALEK